MNKVRLGTDHYEGVGGGGLVISKYNILYSKGTERKIVQGKPRGKNIEQVLSSIQALFLIKKFLHKLLPTKKHAQPIGEKKFYAPENCLAPPSHKNDGASLGRTTLYKQTVLELF